MANRALTDIEEQAYHDVEFPLEQNINKLLSTITVTEPKQSIVALTQIRKLVDDAIPHFYKLASNRTLVNDRARVAKRVLEHRIADALTEKPIVPGEIIKVVGTRDGYGFRLVTEINEHKVECMQLQPIIRSIDRSLVSNATTSIYQVQYGPKQFWLVKKPQITDHGLDKIRARSVVNCQPGKLIPLIKVE